MPIGTNVEGKMVAALRRLGFDKVFDTDFGADMTIMEEATEFIDRVQNGGKLPIITSCSPGWVKFCEHYYPSLTENLSSCKSPQQMTGALIKTWFAEKEGIDPKNIVSVSVMPCVAKKFEINRDDEAAAGMPDVDISITTRELARMIKLAQLNFARLPDEDFDPAMGVSTGASTIFGATGGVLEAALRTAADVLEGTDHAEIEYKEIRGTKGFKEAVYKIAGMDVKVAVASGMSAAHVLLNRVKNGEQFHFIEIMGCPGGCVNGGGQPHQPASVRSFTDLKAIRAAALYNDDASKPVRKSHENPMIKKLYAEYLEKPGSHKAHKILHTSYVDRSKDYIK
jgi:NADP-reducing hydrogenase subunit HndD